MLGTARYVIAILVLVTMAAAQGFQVRTRVDVVVVPVAVRDSKGKLVTGLTQKDFTILEDQKPQTITNFSDDPQPLSAVIVMDTGMGGLAMRRLVPLFIAVTSGFSEFDEMASFRYDHHVFQLSDFTNEQEKIEKSFDIVKTIAEKQPAQVGPGDPTPTMPKILQAILELYAGGLGTHGAVAESVGRRTPLPGTTAPTAGSMRVNPSRVLYDALYSAAKVLEARPATRRKMIFIVSDGQVTSKANTHNLEEIADLLLQNNIQLYAVNTDTNPVDRRFGVLRSLAQATGGDEYGGSNTAAMENAFNQITEQARNQYVLGYQSTNEIAGDLPVIRTIEVKGRQGNWKVTHRKGYTQIP
jgi:VWFA-related protein